MRHIGIAAPGNGDHVVVTGNLIANGLIVPSIGYVHFIRATDGTIERLANCGFVNAMGCTPDGQVIAVASTKGSINLIDGSTMTALRDWPAHEGDIASLPFSHDDKWLASGAVLKYDFAEKSYSDNPTLKTWNVANGTEVDLLKSGNSTLYPTKGPCAR